MSQWRCNKVKYFWTALILFPMWSHAQHLSDLGRFSIDHPRACAPVTISVSKLDNFGDVPRQYFYEQGQVEVSDTFHTYSEPGIYEIVQLIGVDVTPKTDTLTFEVVEGLPPEFNVFACSNTEIAVDITDSYYDFFTVKFTETDSFSTSASDPPVSFDYERNFGQVQVIGYLNNSFRNCGDQAVSFNLSLNPTIDVHRLFVNEECLGSPYLTASINNPDPFSLYKVDLEDASGIFQEVYRGPIENVNTSYSLKNLSIGSTYCARISILNACSQAVLATFTTCDSLQTKRSSIANAYATYVSNGISVQFDSTTGVVNIKRKNSSAGDFSPAATVSQSWLDPNISSSRAYTYELVSVDSCGTLVDSIQISAPFISLEDYFIEDNRVILSEIPAKNRLGNGIKSIFLYNEDSTEYLEKPFSEEFSLPGGLGDLIKFRVRYQYDSLSVFSNELLLDYEISVFVPSAFTPNGDGLNDLIELFGLPTPDFEISIYNRWGDIIENTRQNPVWNGEIGNEIAKEGVYLYRLEFRLPSGELKTQVGSFTLITN